jgi:type II secretory pathway pseudopilin PulG
MSGKLAPRNWARATTLIEVLAAGGVLGVLATLAGPGLARLGDEQKKALCLTNLRQIGAASWQYAWDDARYQLVPLHRSMVRTSASNGWNGTAWWWRTTMPGTFGGQTATRSFPTGGSDVVVMTDPNGIWAAATRPLNRYVPILLSQAKPALAQGKPNFRCPADTGYPNSNWVQDCPPAARGIPCYDFLGNSYRYTPTGLVWVNGVNATGFFISGVWGHTAGSIASPPERTVLYSDSLFPNITYYNGDFAPGWHGEMLSDQVVYVDGSARMTARGTIHEFTGEELKELGYTPNFGWEYFLWQGDTWQTDSYPTPGAQIRMYSDAGQQMTPNPDYYTGWPFDNYQHNERP